MLDKNIYGEVPEIVHSTVLDTLEALEETNSISRTQARRRSVRKFRIPKVAVAGLTCLLLSGITVSAMGIVNLHRQRMEEMNKEQLEEYYSLADAGETTSLNRPFTTVERTRYQRLKEEYENNGLFPESQVTYLENADEYKGKGVGLDASSRTLYLPETELSDEELLEIIDFEHKLTYSIFELNEERIASGSDWESRMTEMDTEKVDEIYLTMFSGNSEISGAYSRHLSDAENVRYEELVKCYEEDGMFATSDIMVIQTSEEYTGVGVAICVEDSTFYLPDSQLTDEEMLQIIDMKHKATYCIDKINAEIDMGLREGYPQR